MSGLFLVSTKALADLRVRENEIQEKDYLLKLMTTERDQALATLNKHGLMAERNAKVRLQLLWIFVSYSLRHSFYIFDC
jgi:hypothetical protein